MVIRTEIWIDDHGNGKRSVILALADILLKIVSISYDPAPLDISKADKEETYGENN